MKHDYVSGCVEAKYFERIIVSMKRSMAHVQAHHKMLQILQCSSSTGQDILDTCLLPKTHRTPAKMAKVSLRHT